MEEGLDYAPDYEEDGGEDTSSKIKTKGRGHMNQDGDENMEGRGGKFESISESGSSGPLKCKNIPQFKIRANLMIFFVMYSNRRMDHICERSS